MDTPYAVPASLLLWLDIAARTSGSSFQQGPAGGYQSSGFDDWEQDPTVVTYSLDTPGTWTRLDGAGDVCVSGRLIGGCIEALSSLSGTPYADLGQFAEEHAPEGLLVYVEAAEASSYDIGRRLHGMKFAGWFNNANAIAHDFAQMNNLPKVGEALKKMVALAPSLPEPRYDLAALGCLTGNQTQALQDLKAAVDLSNQRLAKDPSARDIVATARTDPRLDGIRSLPEFQKLVPPK